MHRRTAAAAAAAAALLTVTAAVPATAAPGAASAPPVDFDGDGYGDLVVSAPDATVGGKAGAGYVAVLFGSADGTRTAGRQVLSRETPGIPGEPAEWSRFGVESVARDLDEDGHTDLVLRDPGAYGELLVLWGSADGLTGGGTTLPGTVYADNPVAGDVNGDGHTDIVSGTDQGLSEDRAGMRVQFGPFTRTGEPRGGEQAVETSEVFGPYEILLGDVTGDGADDIVTTHGFEESAHPTKFWKGGTGGVTGTARTLAAGAAGTVGDVNGDGHADVVLRTVPHGNNDGLADDPGSLKVWYGTAAGPGTRTTVIGQDTAGVPGVSETGDQFGYALRAGDADRDGYADIAVGVPYEDLTAGQRNTGATVLLRGAAKGLSGTGARAFHQSTEGVTGIAEKGDAFGTAVTLTDTNGDGRDELGIGAPGEDGTAAQRDAGAAWVLRGTARGPAVPGLVSFGPVPLGTPVPGARLGTRFTE